MIFNYLHRSKCFNFLVDHLFERKNWLECIWFQLQKGLNLRNEGRDQHDHELIWNVIPWLSCTILYSMIKIIYPSRARADMEATDAFGYRPPIVKPFKKLATWKYKKSDLATFGDHNSNWTKIPISSQNFWICAHTRPEKVRTVTIPRDFLKLYVCPSNILLQGQRNITVVNFQKKFLIKA